MAEPNPFEAELERQYIAETKATTLDEAIFSTGPVSPPPPRLAEELGTPYDGTGEEEGQENEENGSVSGHFQVLDSSLPTQRPERHHLASYVIGKQQSSSAAGGSSSSRHGKHHRHVSGPDGLPRSKWHFGIRSRSPPMEVMLEIYKTLKTLGMEWKEKKDLGGLGGVEAAALRNRDRYNRHNWGPSSDPRDTSATHQHYANHNHNRVAIIARNTEGDGQGYVNLKAAAAIYFVETRTRVQDVVVLMNIQLYNVDSVNYLVDFHHKKSYRASTRKGAEKWDMAEPHEVENVLVAGSPAGSLAGKIGYEGKEDEVVSPFVFMDVACRLILELAGGGQGPAQQA